MIYHPEDAKQFFSSKAGQKYQPSNGTEGDLFMSYFCFRCERDKDHDCDILARTMAHRTEDAEYPVEWQYRADGQPTCTAFVPEGEPIPVPRCEHTADLFGTPSNSTGDTDVR